MFILDLQYNCIYGIHIRPPSKKVAHRVSFHAPCNNKINVINCRTPIESNNKGDWDNKPVLPVGVALVLCSEDRQQETEEEGDTREPDQRQNCNTTQHSDRLHDTVIETA